MAKKAGRGKGRGAVIGGSTILPGEKPDKPAKAKKVDVTIVIQKSGVPEPYAITLSSSDWNRVRFDNQADRGITVTFPSWPFLEAPTPIPMEAGKKSKWFNIPPGELAGRFDYSMSPDLLSGDSFPDPPGLSFE